MSSVHEFRKMYLEITTACNLACDFCPGTSRPIQFIDLARVDRYIAMLAPLSGVLHLHVMGEPLHHPEFALILDRCVAHGAKVNIVTNGTLLSRHAAALLDSPAIQQISISLHSLEANSGQSSAAYISGVIDFLSSRKCHPNISLRIWNRKQSLASKDTQSFLAALCAAGITTDTPTHIMDSLHLKGALQISEALFINTAEQFEWPSLDTPDQGEAGRCQGLIQQIAVLVDGTVVPCCLDRDGVTALGNLETQTLSEILDSPRARTLRAGFMNGRISEPLCRHCTYRNRFKKGINTAR